MPKLLTNSPTAHALGILASWSAAEQPTWGTTRAQHWKPLSNVDGRLKPPTSVREPCPQCATPSSCREHQTRIAVLRSSIQVLPVVAEPAGVWHEHALLAVDVRPQVPRRSGLGKQRPIAPRSRARSRPALHRGEARPRCARGGPTRPSGRPRNPRAPAP